MVEDVSLVVIRPEAFTRMDVIEHWLTDSGYQILDRRVRGGWRELVPKLYTYGPLEKTQGNEKKPDIPEEVLDDFLKAHDVRGLPDVCAALLVRHLKGDTLSRVVESIGTARNYQEGTLRKEVGKEPLGRWDFPGVHKPSTAQSLAQHVRLFFGQAAVEKYL